jgi:hypothetical protein
VDDDQADVPDVTRPKSINDEKKRKVLKSLRVLLISEERRRMMPSDIHPANENVATRVVSDSNLNSPAAVWR